MWRFPTIAGPLAAAVATHHERADGTGYPNGLTGADLPALGRLLRVADVYAALNEDRPHRPALDPRAALTEVLLMAEQGQVDRDFAEYLLHLAFYPVGTLVELTDGRTGVVAANHPNRLDPRASIDDAFGQRIDLRVEETRIGERCSAWSRGPDEVRGSGDDVRLWSVDVSFGEVLLAVPSTR